MIAYVHSNTTDSCPLRALRADRWYVWNVDEDWWERRGEGENHLLEINAPGFLVNVCIAAMRRIFTNTKNDKSSNPFRKTADGYRDGEMRLIDSALQSNYGRASSKRSLSLLWSTVRRMKIRKRWTRSVVSAWWYCRHFIRRYGQKC